MSYNLRLAVVSLTILGSLVPASMAVAGTLLPNPANGNPHGAGPVNDFVVSLIPDPAIPVSGPRLPVARPRGTGCGSAVQQRDQRLVL